jgi:hypothetical protein
VGEPGIELGEVPVESGCTKAFATVVEALVLAELARDLRRARRRSG